MVPGALQRRAPSAPSRWSLLWPSLRYLDDLRCRLQKTSCCPLAVRKWLQPAGHSRDQPTPRRGGSGRRCWPCWESSRRQSSSPSPPASGVASSIGSYIVACNIESPQSRFATSAEPTCASASPPVATNERTQRPQPKVRPIDRRGTTSKVATTVSRDDVNSCCCEEEEEATLFTTRAGGV